MRITRRSAIGNPGEHRLGQQQSNPSRSPKINATLSIAWLDRAAPGLETGVSWGVPGLAATVRREQTFALSANDGKPLPLQSWPLAYWPDGSIKFTRFATVTAAPGPFRLDARHARQHARGESHPNRTGRRHR
jgi:hypothetical protein